MNKIGGFFSHASHYFNKDLSANPIILNTTSSFENIKISIEKDDHQALNESLNKLCGDGGEAKITPENFQIQLYFKTKPTYQLVKKELNKCIFNDDMDKIEKWQTKSLNKCFTLELTKNQSVALLGLDPNLTDDCQIAERILKSAFNVLSTVDDKEQTCHLLNLPGDLLTLVSSILPLNTLSKFAKVNIKISTFIESNITIWRVVAGSLGVTLNNGPISPKKQIHDTFIKELSYDEGLSFGTINLLNKQVIINKNIERFRVPAFQYIFDTYVPAAYFLKYSIENDSDVTLYRDSNGDSKELLSPGTYKESWEPGEADEWKKVHLTMKEFKVMENLNDMA